MKIFKFITVLIKEINNKNLLSSAAELTYNLLLSFFPFIIFLFSIIGFLNVDPEMILGFASIAFPDEIINVLNDFVGEVVSVRSVGLLSTSFMMSLYSSSSGIRAALRGINRAHQRKDTRGVIKLYAISVAIIFALAVAIVCSMLALVFSDVIIKRLQPVLADYRGALLLFGSLKYIVSMIFITAVVMFIYRMASQGTVPWKNLLPGALVTAVVWVVTSKLFNIYINNFSHFSMVYGSIAGIFILILWLHVISALLLTGSEINAMLRNC